MPCKGGSGATFLATNLACQLAETSSVLLIDLNLQFGDALAFVQRRQAGLRRWPTWRTTSAGSTPPSCVASTVKVAPNFSVLAAPEDLARRRWRSRPSTSTPSSTLAVPLFDFVLLDVGRNLNTLAIRALDRAHRIYPVLQPGLPAMRNAAKLLAVFKSLGYPADKIELIVNRFEKAGEIGLTEMQRSLGRRPACIMLPNPPRRWTPRSTGAFRWCEIARVHIR